MTVRHDPELEPTAIRAAAERIPAAFRHSPQYINESLAERAGCPVVVKIETTNPVGAFKGRGTWLMVHELAAAGRIGSGRPVAVASTGNFGQGVAYAARALGIEAVVFADERANPLKLDKIRRYGARLVLAGHDFDAARVAAEQHARETGAYLLVDGREPTIAAGAATLAVELTDATDRGDLPALGSVYAPVGNGALIVGVGAWLRHAVPGCRVVGVQSEAAPSMTLSWRAGRPIETPTAGSYAEGVNTRVPVPEALEMMAGRVDDMLLVSEDAIRAAQEELTQAIGVTVEGAAGVSWAGLLADPGRRGPSLVLVTGSNVAPTA